jgi:hypothetical protein
MQTNEKIYPRLEEVTKPRLTTAEVAYYTNFTAQTWREKACYDKMPEDMRPMRICGRLAWPTEGVKKFLGVAA